MRRLVPFILFWGFVAAGCGPANDRSAGGSVEFTGTTGASNEKGVPFVSADPRMEQALSEPVPLPVSTTESKPEEPKKPEAKPAVKTEEPEKQPAVVEVPKKLGLRMKEYEISRFKAGETVASRFGDERLTIKIFLDEHTVKFDANFTGGDGRFAFSGKSGIYTIKGTLDDNAPSKSLGDFVVTDTKSGETARILYAAFKAKLTVREDSSKSISAGSDIEKQIRALRENTFAWVNNWSTVYGTSFYLIDIVKMMDAGDVNVLPPPVVAIKGQSLRTGDQDQPAKYVLPSFSRDISLIGNSETEDRRWFQTKLSDPNTKEENDIIIDVQSDQSVANESLRNGTVVETPAPPAPAPVETAKPKDLPLPAIPPAPPAPKKDMALPTIPNEKPQPVVSSPATPSAKPVVPAAPAPAAPPQTKQSSAPVAGPSTPKAAPAAPPAAPAAPAKPSTPAAPAAPPAAQKPKAPEYKPQTILEPVNYNGSFLRIDNSLPRTNRMTKDFERNRNLPGVKKWIQNYTENWRSGYGKELLAFLTHANSFRPLMEHVARSYDVSPMYAYVTVIESAYFTGGKYVIQWGPGGTSLGPFQIEGPTARSLNLRMDSVDERRYFAPSACGAARYFAKLVDMFPHDTTLAIMGYNFGEGNASRIILCTYSSGDCGGDMYRAMKRAQNYKYSFADIASVNAAPAIRIRYVEKSLAAYFIASDLASYGISLPAIGKLPENANLLPPQPIHDPTCRSHINAIFSN